MTTREDVTIQHLDSTISATVLLEGGEAFDFENILLSTSGTHDIELNVAQLTDSTVRELYETAERQHNSFVNESEY